MLGVGSNLFTPATLSGLIGRKVSPAAAPTSSKTSLQDVVSLSSAAQSGSDSTTKSTTSANKKSFKNLKEYMAYVMLTYQKMARIKPETSTGAVRLEDRAEFAKLSNELNSLKDVNILS